MERTRAREVPSEARTTGEKVGEELLFKNVGPEKLLISCR